MKTPAIELRLLLLVAGLVLGSSLLAQGTPAPGSGSKIDPTLQAELLAIYDADQNGRLQIDAVQKKYGSNSPEMRALWKSINEKDAINLAKVEAILDTHGWLGPEAIGPKANACLFLVIQHADTAAQQKYLPLMRTAVREKKAHPSQLALLEDRVALAEGRPQTYGSQLFSPRNGDQVAVSPMADPDHVDARRAAMGLPPMAEYLKHWNLQWDLEAYKKQLPELAVAHWGCLPKHGGFDKTLQAELLAIYEDQQQADKQRADVMEKFGAASPEFQALQQAINERKAASLAKVKELIDGHGWISCAEVGRQASQTIMRALGSADLATKKHYLTMLRFVVANTEAEGRPLAELEDSVAVQEGRRQIYGTMLSRDDKTAQFYVVALEDPDHVDARRAAVGLEPMADFLRPLGLTWNAEVYKQQLATLEALGAKK